MYPLAFALWLGQPAPETFNPLPAVLPMARMEADAIETIGKVPFTSPIAELTPRVPVGAARNVDADVYSSLNQIGDKRKATTRLNANWAAMSGQLTVSDPDWVRNDPLGRGHSWATDETLKVTVNDSLFVFGAVDVESKSVAQQQLRWLGKTGVGFKLRPWMLDELHMRGGSALRYDDEERTAQGVAPERSELFVEVSTKLPLPLLGAVNVEYTGTAIAAITAAERERIKQNLKFALPLSDSSQFHVGARWRSDDTASVTPFIDRAQLYLGVQLKR